MIDMPTLAFENWLKDSNNTDLDQETYNVAKIAFMAGRLSAKELAERRVKGCSNCEHYVIGRCYQYENGLCDSWKLAEKFKMPVRQETCDELINILMEESKAENKGSDYKVTINHLMNIIVNKMEVK